MWIDLLVVEPEMLAFAETLFPVYWITSFIIILKVHTHTYFCVRCLMNKSWQHDMSISSFIYWWNLVLMKIIRADRTRARKVQMKKTSNKNINTVIWSTRYCRVDVADVIAWIQIAQMVIFFSFHPRIRPLLLLVSTYNFGGSNLTHIVLCTFYVCTKRRI